MSARIRQELGIDELRERFAEYTRAAYASLPSIRTPQILELGCGRGAVTFRLARLSGSESEVVGIDIDGGALADLARRIEVEGFSRRVRILQRSLLVTGFADERFGLVWAEGGGAHPGVGGEPPRVQSHFGAQWIFRYGRSARVDGAPVAESSQVRIRARGKNPLGAGLLVDALRRASRGQDSQSEGAGLGS